MNQWSNPNTPQLLTRLLRHLDAQQTELVSDERRMAGSIGMTGLTIRNCLLNALEANNLGACPSFLEALAGDGTQFTLFSHQFGALRNAVLRQVLNRGDIEEARDAFASFEDLEEKFAAAHLRKSLATLRERNGQRLAHIRSLSDKNILIYFESHLEWIDKLITAVEKGDASLMPELDHTRCEFGRWLHGSDLIRDRDYQENLQRMHASMHHIVIEIRSIIDYSRASAPIYDLLKKAETYSLELGNEISLLNNMVIMSAYNKDPLTGFLSRRFMERVMLNQMEIAKATETAFSVIMFDLDHFKQINDTYGHPTGDRVLEHIAGIVRSSLRQSDLVFRYGGEEFLVVLPSTPIQQTRQLAEKLRLRIEQSPLPGDEALSITASFGVLPVIPESYKVVDTVLIQEIISECDARLYTAKHRGRNCIA